VKFSCRLEAVELIFPWLFLQLGMPAGREEYVHRLGRTGRAGKEGRGVLILAPWENGFLRALKDIPITENKDLEVTRSAAQKVFFIYW
jgi:superfamily II DNA/RNA helicase